MNPTNFQCPSDISRFVTTDYRPNKVLYQNVYNNNQFRSWMQQNANNIRNRNLQDFVTAMNCRCEKQQTCGVIKPFSSSKLDDCSSSGGTYCQQMYMGPQSIGPL